MSWLIHEIRLIMRSRLSLASLLLLFTLSSLAVWSGLHEVQQQHQTIAHLAQLHTQDVAAVAKKYGQSPNAGNPAYYTFHNTWDTPSHTAFIALGLRDVVPYVLRIRALGLQAQLYEGETFNPELALAGRFDFAFVLIYLAPLFIIALLHDLVSGEKQSGRLRLLLAMPGSPGQLWRRRALLRLGLLLWGLLIPLWVGMVIAQTPRATVGLLSLIVLSYAAFWTGLALLVAVRGQHSVTHATALMGTWVILTLVLPTLANMVLTRAIPVHQGVDLMLSQRQNTHGAWEISRTETLKKFVKSHPEWQDTAPLPPGFHWKWYFAFHQLGDESVAPQAQVYRENLQARQQWTQRLGWLLPSIGAQAILHRAADTDLQAQLAYQDQIATFHQTLRHFYYSYLFNERPFGTDDFAKQPVFSPRPPTATGLGINGLILLVQAWLFFALGLWRLEKIALKT